MLSEKHVVLIHGSWVSATAWNDMATLFEHLGFVVHTPTLRFHELPLAEGAAKLGSVSLDDYVEDIRGLVRGLSAPPLLVGHSLGGLIAQLVAAKVPHTGLVLLAPAPAAGIFVAHSASAKMFLPYFLHWAFWRKPMLPPRWETWAQNIGNEQPLDIQRQHFSQLCAESGRAYFEMVFWFLDRRRAAVVHYEAITGPVLVFGASLDRAVHPEIGRRTAARYAHGRYVELAGSDHLMIAGRYCEVVMGHVEQWLREQ